jgi:hypothetical protein
MLPFARLAAWIRVNFETTSRPKRVRVRRSFKPGLEELEHRLVPSAVPGPVPAKIALLAADAPTYVADVKAKIVSTGRFTSAQVDIIPVGNFGSTTPSLATLDQYAAVLVWEDFNFADPTTLGNNLAAYVNQGHGVVEAVFATASEPLTGLWQTGGYNAIAPSGARGNTDLQLGAVAQPNHPVMVGVHSFDGGSRSYESTGGLAPNSAGHTSSLIASWSNGSPLVAERTGFMGHVVDLDFFPPSSDTPGRADFWQANTDGAKLMANALVYAETPPPPPHVTVSLARYRYH